MTTHKLQPYYRPRSMGGDVAHPLCLAPVTGWAGPKLATFPMVEADRHVDCPNCLGHMANGGMASRLAEQAQRLASRAPVVQRRAA